jgi:hypothetical protein
LAIQYSSLTSNPAIGLIGSWARILSKGSSGVWIESGSHKHPTEDPILQWRLLWNSPFVHSSVLMRRAAIDDAGGYSTEPDRQMPEDYDLWSRMARVTRLANVPEFLQSYRSTPGGLSRTRAAEISAGVMRIAKSNLADVLSLDSSDPSVIDLARTLNGMAPADRTLPALIDRVRLLRQTASGITGFAGPQAWKELVRAEARVIKNSLTG